MPDNDPSSRDDPVGRDSRPRTGSSPTDSDEWTVRIGGRVSWSRVLVVGTWLAVAASVLIWVRGPFWYSGVDWYRQAREAAERGDLVQALEDVERAREAAPDDAGLATFQGHARLGAGEPVGALQAFREARALDPGAVEPLLGLAEVHLARGDTAAARSALEESVGLAPGAADRIRLADLAEAAGDPELALETLVGPPAVGSPAHRIRLARRLERWPLVVELLQEVLAAPASSPASPDIEAERLERRRQLARALQASGREAGALDEYRALASDGGLDAGAAVQYAWLLDQRGRYTEALDVLDAVRPPTAESVELAIRTAIWAGRLDEAERRLAADLEEPRPADSTLVALRRELSAARERLASAREAGRIRAEAEARARAEEEARERIARDTPPDDASAALEFWSERLRRTPTDSVARTETVALLESFERFDEAARVLRAGREPEEIADPDTLLRLARLAQWAERPGAVIRWVERYDALHGPVPDSARLMLARAYEATGRNEDALRSYERLRENGIEDGGGIEHAEVTLAVARLRAATEDAAGATVAYEAYLEDRPGDLQVRLELARHLASGGILDRAREQYARYRSDGGPEAVALEIARVELGRERFDAAVEAARSAVRETEEGEGPRSPLALEARLALAEALRYSGQRGEAEELLEDLTLEEADPVFRARVARLRDRPLEALDILEESTTAEAHLLAAGAAMDAGQWARARRALDSAAAVGVAPGLLEPVQERLRRGTAPTVAGLVSGGSDDVDFAQLQGGIAAGRWVAGDRVRLRSSVESVFLSQGSVDRELVSATVGGDSLLVGDATFLAGDVGVQLSDSDETTLSGTLRALRHFRDGSSLGLDVDRAPIWEAENGFEPLRYSRVRDLPALGVDLMETDLSVRGRKALGIGRGARVDAGLTWYSDGNRRSFVYTHIELPVDTRVGRWISLQPNAYVEWFDRSLPTYASPSRYLAAGVRALGIWEGDVGSLRLEMNPHFFDYPGESGLGLNAEAEASRHLRGPVEVTIQGFYSGQEGVYDQYRASMGLRWTLGGSGS